MHLRCNRYAGKRFLLAISCADWFTTQTMNKLTALASSLLLAASASAAEPSLREVVGNRLLIGTAAMSYQLADPKLGPLISSQFNCITPENEMKPIEVHPAKDQWNFGPGDKIVAFAKEHGMKVIGHNLCWHSQSPKFLYQDEKGNPLPREQALANLKEHIEKVAGHFKGQVLGWDVVNEALNDGPGTFRDGPAHKAIGDDFIEKAFEFAHAADPDAQLYYNDYNIEQDYKRPKLFALLKQLKEHNTPIYGVGIQAHFLITSPAVADLEKTVPEIEKMGLKVMLTELDVDVLPRRGTGADVSRKEEAGENFNPYVNGLPEDVAKKEADLYADIFKYALAHKSIERVTLWGSNDATSWLNGFPRFKEFPKGRTNHALLFDRDNKPKLAFEEVIKVLQENK